MNPHAQDTYTQSYNKWVKDPSPTNMAELVSAFMPTINSEIQQYSGSKALLRARAKSYVVGAIRSYNPLGTTKLNSWVVTNLKQLARYGKRLRPVRASEDIIRNSAEMSKTVAELEDQLGRKPTDEEIQDATGWNQKTIDKIRSASITTTNMGNSEMADAENGPEDPATGRLDTLPFAQEAVYMSLPERDQQIYDYRLGQHGKSQMTGKEIADLLGVTPAYISQRASGIGAMISELGAK